MKDNDQIPQDSDKLDSADISFSPVDECEEIDDFSIDSIIAEFHDSDSAEGTQEEEAAENPVAVPPASESVCNTSDEDVKETAVEVDPVEVSQQETEDSFASEVTEVIEEEFIPAGPIIFKPRYRGTEMRRQIISGPERRYYELQEMGVGKLQLAILFTLLAFLLSAGTTAFYHFGINIESSVRLLVFSQFFSVFFAAIFGCYLLMDGIGDLFHGRFTLNSFLTFTFVACAADCIICLKTLQMPFGSVLCLEMLMALLAEYEKRTTEMGQSDTMRKANYLDATTAVPEFYEGKTGFKRRDGDISEYLETSKQISGPEKAQSAYALIAFAVCIAVCGLGFYRKGSDYAFHVLAGSMLCALPATFFLTESRPTAILERRLHKLGVVICGWQGVKGLCKKAVYPLSDEDIFPVGALTLNGVKFYGEHMPDQILGYATALAEAQGSNWASVFLQLLESRSGPRYMVDEFVFYDNGGVGGIINEQAVLMGTGKFMREMGVELPSGNQVEHPVYLSVGNSLCAVFALTYHKDKLSAAGLSVLAGCRNLTTVYTGNDCIVEPDFLQNFFKVKTKRFLFPSAEIRHTLADTPVLKEAPALLLTTRNHLASRAYAISGARTLNSCVRFGTVLHIIAGTLGLLSAAAIAFLGNEELLSAGNVLLYNLLWLVPGFIPTEWTRSL